MNNEPKKALGQHWLRDHGVLRSIVDFAGIQSHDTVLEIGPGLGTLTEILAKRAQQVVAVEYDKQLARQLHTKFLQGPTLLKTDEGVLQVPLSTGSDPVAKDARQGRVEIVEGDIRKFDLSQLPVDYKVVANIPYYLSGEIMRLLTESLNPPASMTLLMQKEVAERLSAPPGQMSLSSVAAQLFGSVSLGPIVPAHLFTPPPKVDSQVVRIVRHKQPLFPDLDRSIFWRVIKAGFSAKRKQLRSSLAGGLHLTKQDTENLLQNANISPTARPQELSLDQWHTITRLL